MAQFLSHIVLAVSFFALSALGRPNPCELELAKEVSVHLWEYSKDLTENVLLNAIASGDATAMVAYLDYLADNGQAERKEFIELDIRLGEMKPDDPGQKTVKGRRDALLRKNRTGWFPGLQSLRGVVFTEKGFPSFEKLIKVVTISIEDDTEWLATTLAQLESYVPFIVHVDVGTLKELMLFLSNAWVYGYSGGSWRNFLLELERDFPVLHRRCVKPAIRVWPFILTTPPGRVGGPPLEEPEGAYRHLRS